MLYYKGRVAAVADGLMVGQHLLSTGMAGHIPFPQVWHRGREQLREVTSLTSWTFHRRAENPDSLWSESLLGLQVQDSALRMGQEAHPSRTGFCRLWCSPSTLPGGDLLLNQTWVHFTVCSKANLLIPGCGKAKYRFLYCSCRAKRTGSSCSEDLNLLMAFREGLLKATFAVRVAGGMTFFRLVGS